MIKYTRLRAQPWVCAQCRVSTARLPRQQQRHGFGRRFPAQTAPASTSASAPATATTTATTGLRSGPKPDDARTASRLTADHRANTGQEREDDVTLRAIFDSEATWAAFSKAAATASPRRVGLFGNAFLTEPAGFRAYTLASLRRAQGLVEKVARARSAAEFRAIVGDLDRLSDLLCRVIDLCDFVRGNAPDAATAQAANEAWATAYQYMNELNTTSVLNDQLGVALAKDAEAEAAGHSGWSEEEKTVATMLQQDFAKSAADVNMPQEARDRFVELSQRINEVGTHFVDTIAPATSTVQLPSTSCLGLDPGVARRFTRGNQIVLPAGGGDAVRALRAVRDPDARKKLLYATRTAAPETVMLLEQLVSLRADLARVSGFESYGHMALRDRMMARSPESVRRFLHALADHNAPRVQAELAELTAAKAASTGSDELLPWDRDYYMDVVRARAPPPSPLAPYFSLGTVMQGLSRLFQRLYGLRLVPRPTPPGETWHPDVRRLDVISDTDGHVAVLYCDLFYRHGKSPNPAHFTVRCSRAIGPDEAGEAVAAVAEAAAAMPGFAAPDFASADAAANDGMATARARDSGQLMQLPTIALVCDFQRDRGSAYSLFGRRRSSFSPLSEPPPALLNIHEVETLFHEMGHAVHSVLARTALQAVAGTRCATDLAELPSTLMEHFVADPAVLGLYARHYETDEPLDPARVAASLQHMRRFPGIADEGQIVLALLDQELHLRAPGAPAQAGFSTRLFHQLQTKVGLAPADPPGTSWQGFFGHLFGYGSTYYSYLFDRVLADRVWRKGFAGGRDGAALSRDNGEHLRESLLRWGGSRDPWRCVADALRDPRIAGGDEDAMALVGSWGTIHKESV